ncbi:MAG: class I mannose-6-phosphate isomerase [Bacteroidaceae bacterium]|nr:class I mannose-6-phosphate isomerase [Bacteroidaceae bacterium]MBQ4057245.1 class I mannose-6-phosphate isomerase [Bacteroidaceae bacterium]
MRKSNYDKFPSTPLEGNLIKGWDSIFQTLKEKLAGKGICVIECYQGVYIEELEKHLPALEADLVIKADNLYHAEEKIRTLTQRWVTDDRLFGRRASFTYQDFLDEDKVKVARNEMKVQTGLTLVYGHGAFDVAGQADVVVYIDMARWEIQQRSRRKEIDGLGVSNREEDASRHYKRGYFVDWIVCDELKKRLLPIADYWMDTHVPETPKMITGELLRQGLTKTAHRPFRVVPFFDPAPWGGQWMKEVCDLDRSKSNYGWCFDCVPEENSLYLKVEGELFEIPSNNVVFHETKALLGAPVESRFGEDFPIRFDFLDTMEGGNLSLQVHPTTQYIRDTFGIYYTQDESYYLLDATDEATVYLGLKTDVCPEEMINELNEAQNTGQPFDVEKFVNKWPAKKHDHYLIPNGTIHCSGSGAMVLEISATPSIFTFKLYDWGRLGLDGLPRPINIKHGSKVIQWERQTDLIRKDFINAVQPIAEGEGWREERTGLHENEFIETRRHWFTSTVTHPAGTGVNVLNLIEGEEAIVESPTGLFDPFVVHYAETFIIPASVGEYTIRPYGLAEGKECATIKAYVRFKN